jgi:hypothetical protein
MTENKSITDHKKGVSWNKSKKADRLLLNLKRHYPIKCVS